MTEARVTGVSSIEFAVRDVDRAAAFYTETWALEEIEGENGVRYFRGTGPDRYILALHRGDAPALLRINLTAPGRDAVDALRGRLAERRLPAVGAPGPVPRPGGGYGFEFRDPEGRQFSVTAGAATHAPEGDVADRPSKVSHCVLNAGDMEGSIAFFRDALGFRISDRTRTLCFLRCNNDHHSIALGDSELPTLHHVAFEMPDLESVMRGAGRMRDAGFPIEWGIGRHGPGNNVFAYFLAPEGFVIEYTAEVEQVDESYPTGGPEDWSFVGNRTDQWGVTDPPSRRMRAAHDTIAFVPPSAA